jgi:chemotaxis protein methyltransferase CheR
MTYTFFMHDQPIFEEAADHMIPYAGGRSRIKIWDAGCAKGQETYTLAMILAERMDHSGFNNVRIDATDNDNINHFEEVVSEAVYHGDELIRTPADLFEKYFEPAAKPEHYRVSDVLRSRVRFRYHDLLSLTPAGNNYCLVVCKNVLLYFKPREQVEVFRRFHKALAPGGYLATENTQKLPEEMSEFFTQVEMYTKLYKKTENRGALR